MRVQPVFSYGETGFFFFFLFGIYVFSAILLMERD